MIWHVLTDGTEYAYARPAFAAMKLRRQRSKPALHASMARRDLPGRDYWIKEIREQEADYVRHAGQAYRANGGGVEGKEAALTAPAMTALRVADDSLLSAPSVDISRRPSSM